MISLYVSSIGIFLLNLSLFMATVYKFYKCQQLTNKQVREGPSLIHFSSSSNFTENKSKLFGFYSYDAGFLPNAVNK